MKRPPGLSAFVIVPKKKGTTKHEHAPYKLRLVPITRFEADEEGLSIIITRRTRAVLVCACGATSSITEDDSIYDLRRGSSVRGWTAPRRRR